MCLQVPLRDGIGRRDADRAADVAKKIENSARVSRTFFPTVASATLLSGTKIMESPMPLTAIGQNSVVGEISSVSDASQNPEPPSIP